MKSLDKNKTKKYDWKLEFEMRADVFSMDRITRKNIKAFIGELLDEQKKEIEAKWIKFFESEGYSVENKKK